jgi:hypothetical protein
MFNIIPINVNFEIDINVKKAIIVCEDELIKAKAIRKSYSCVSGVES